MSSSFAGNFLRVILSPFELFLRFVRAPLQLHLVDPDSKTIRSAAALYFASGVLNIFSILISFWKINNISNGSIDFSIIFDYLGIKIFAIIFSAFIDPLYVIVVIPGAYFLSKREKCTKSFKNIFGFLFCIGSIVVFIKSSIVFIMYFLVSFPEIFLPFIGFRSIIQLATFVPILILGFIYLLSLKRFVAPVGWWPVIGMFAITIVLVVPFNYTLSFLLALSYAFGNLT